MTSDGGLHGGIGSEFATAAAALRAERVPRNTRLRDAEAALSENRLAEAQEILGRVLERHTDDPFALNLMAVTVSRMGRKEEAAALLAKCVALDKDFAAARYEYASLLFQLNKTDEALTHIDELLTARPRNLLFRDFKSAVLTAIGNYSGALRGLREMAEDCPHSPEIWVKYGAALRSVGQREQCIAAYRKAIELLPQMGEAYWSLACLRNYRFSGHEIVQMQTQLAQGSLSGEERMYFHFALGSALAAQGRYEKSFENYTRGNALKRLTIEYDPDSLRRHVQACKALMTEKFFRARRDLGCMEPGPIFIIGMQRAGSTLVEQILASHSSIEPTAELPNISLLAEHLGEKVAPEYGSKYPQVLEKLSAITLRNLGEQYMETTRSHRRLGRPFFIDKMPYNFLHLGLMLLILPNAKIIDVRRHPLGCCFSNFAMHFRSGPLFGYRLAELGHAYASYVELLAHFDRIMPGRVHRIIYENLVRSPENEVHAVLDYIGLPFENTCLEFHRSKRAMNSASSEQVRERLYDDAINHWRNYEQWLGPLKKALGSILETYPEVPEVEK